jgi:flagellar basal body-associated protein FliL
MAKLKLILPVLLVLLAAGGGAYKFVLAPKPAEAAKKPKIEGELMPLDGEFIVNLAGGHYGKLSIALLFKTPPAMSGGGEGGGTPELVQAAAVRATITDELTGLASDELIERRSRHHVQQAILKDLRSNTDLDVDEVLFTDVVVQ